LKTASILDLKLVLAFARVSLVRDPTSPYILWI
jgi:hypothetical protein